mgnify:CR=1 FL=1
MGKKISELTEISSAPSNAYTVIEHGGQNYKVKPSGFSGGGGGFAGSGRLSYVPVNDALGTTTRVPRSNGQDAYDSLTGILFSFHPKAGLSGGTTVGAGANYPSGPHPTTPFAFTTDVSSLSSRDSVDACTFINACNGVSNTDSNSHSYDAAANPVCFVSILLHVVNSTQPNTVIDIDGSPNANSFWAISGLDPSTVPEGIPGCDAYNSAHSPTSLNPGTGGTSGLPVNQPINYASLDGKLYVEDYEGHNTNFVYGIIRRDLEQTINQYFTIPNS